MSTPSISSRLDAINVILTAVGEQPVSSLSNTTADAANADAVLTEIDREVQTKGWNFNTDYDVPLTPNGDGEIIMPDTTLRADVSAYEHPALDVTMRGRKLYDKATRSHVFTIPVKATVVTALTFEDLPEACRRYITVRAARVYHDRFVGTETAHRFTAEDETRALIAFMDTEHADAALNIFTGNPRFQAGLSRR